MAFEFNNPILYFLRAGNSEDPYISKSDSRLIVNNTITLSEIPNEFSGTTILNYFETRSNTAIESNQFFVNYLNGAISFNPSENGKTVVANYLGRGIIQIPAERIYSTDGNDVTQTLQNMINNGSVAIETLGGLTAAISTAQSLENELDSDIATGNILKSDLDSRFNTADTKKIALDLSISNSNTSKTNLDASISTSGASKTALDLSNTNANITKSNLDSSNTTALATKVLLDGSNTTALETKIALDLSDTTANITKNNLDDSIDSAAIINGTLDGTIVTANFSIGELNETNATAQANELTRISQENIRESQEENRQSTYSSGHISFKGVVTGIASLPTSSNILGDTYQVIDDAITANNAMWRYSGTIFEKSYVLDLTFAGGYGANNSQVFTATEGQTVFTLTEFPYLVNVNQLMVYVAGIKQIIGINYTETSTNSFTLTSGVVAGTKVEAFRSVPGGAGSLTTQEVENARVSSLGVGYANLKARIDAHDFEKVGVLSGLPTVVKTDVVSSINEFYDDVASYKEDNATHEKFIKIVNATNIQDAIDSFTSGGTVILANGEYEIDPFEITNDYVTVKSDGLTILKCKQAYSLVDGDYDVCGQGNIIHAVGRKGITLKNITLKGSYDQLKHFKQNVYDKVVPTEMGYKLLNFDSCESIKLISFNIINSYSNYVDRGLMTNYDFFRSVYGFNPFGISNSKNILLQDCEWKESDGEAWQIFNSTDITVTGCKFNVVFCVSMLDLTFCKDLTITNNQFKRTLTTGGNLVNLASANYIFADNLVINGLVDIGNESLNEGIDVGINFSCENIQIHDNTIINGCLTDQTSNDSYNALYTLRNVTIGGNAIRYNLDDMDQSDIGSIFFIKGILIGPYGKFKDIEISNNKISVEGTLTHTNSRLQLIGVMCDTVSLISDRNTEEVVIKDNVIDTSKMIFDKLFFPNSSGAILLVGHSILNNVTIKGNKIKCHLGIEFIAVSTIEDMTISNNEYYSGVTPIESINSQDCIYKGYHTFINYNLPNGVTIKDLQIRDNISECIGFLTLSNFASLDTYNFKNISIRENKHTTKAYTSSDGVIRAVRLMKDQITFNGATIDMIGNTFINENAIAVGLALYYTERVILDDNIFLGKHSLTLSNSASNVATGVVIIKDNYADDFAKSYTNLPNKTNITKNSSAFSAGLLPTLPLDEVYYDSVTNTLKAWNGAIWKTSVALT